MKITVAFKNIPHTEALDEKIQQKSQKLEKFLDGNTEIQWFCHVKDHLHYADVKLIAPTITLNAEASSDSLYKTLDLVVSKLAKQLQKKKEKWKNHLHQGKELHFENENDSESDEEQYTGSDQN